MNLGPIASFSKIKLTGSSGKELEEIDNAKVICVMYNLKSSSRDSVDPSDGFYRSIDAQKGNWLILKQLKEPIMLDFVQEIYLVLHNIKIIVPTVWFINQHFKERMIIMR